MRHRYIQDPETHKLIPAEEYRPPQERHHFIAPDIGPYRSMETGEMITSRSRHREHLRRHGLVEVGNETKYITQKPNPPKPDRERRKRDIADAINGRGY